MKINVAMLLVVTGLFSLNMDPGLEPFVRACMCSIVTVVCFVSFPIEMCEKFNIIPDFNEIEINPSTLKSIPPNIHIL